MRNADHKAKFGHNKATRSANSIASELLQPMVACTRVIVVGVPYAVS
ncbi:hypothetical protein [Rivularia sp. UHCC 0363]|nr:hypothetical protein [Rivularia sp. UHCC 0363]MEA5595026.1 hypothetical protein [Rivularia sp. UHCC 0363]